MTDPDQNADIINKYLGRSQPVTMGGSHRSGYVAVVGRPNVGKSTLVNALIGHKVAIVSPKPQTTRRRILGILSRPDAQVLFVDTPGIHQPQHALNKFMMREVGSALDDCDAILFVVDMTGPPGPGDRSVAMRIAGARQPVLLAMNKADLLDPRDVVARVEHYEALVARPAADPAAPEATTVAQLWSNERAILTSGTRGDNLPKLLDMLLSVLPQGPQYYPPDQVTDQSERVLVAELVREQALRFLEQEVPHAIAVQVEEFTERKGGGAHISATLFVERDSQKGILIGEGGRMLKRIGSEARKAIEIELGHKVFLELWVKVRGAWRRDERAVDELVN